jgi:tetratricopeptide (TPR) repeat protein
VGRLQQVITELRRRRVLRALFGWAVVSFAVLQVVEPVLHALRLPDGALTAVVAVLALGFPVTVVLAWFFDLTRTGIRRTAGEVACEAGAAPAGRRHVMLFAGLVAVGALIGAGVAWLALRRDVPPPDAEGRLRVAVADFANETGDPDLDALSGLLVTALEPSPRLRVLTRGRLVDVLRQLGKEKAEHIDESLAREAGARAGARALLLASVRRLGESYVVELRGLDPEKDHYLFTAREEARGKEGILPLVDRLAERVRRALHDASPVEPQPPPTSSLEAYRHYFEALRHEDHHRGPEAQAELRAALKEDPDFTLAHLRLAVPVAYFAEPLPTREASLHLRAAEVGLTRLPPRERLVAEAELAWAGGRREQARAAYERALAMRGDDKYAVLRLAWLRAHDHGYEAGRDLADRALALDPAWPPAQDYVLSALVMRGELARALELSRGWAERWPSAWTSSYENLVLLAMGDAEAALRVARRVAEPSREVGDAIERRTLLQLGRAEELESLARQAWQRGERWDFLSLPYVAMIRGKRREAEALAGALEREGLATYAALIRFVLAAVGGDPARAAALAEQAGVGEGTWGSIVLALAGAADAAMRPGAFVNVEMTAEWRDLARGLSGAGRARQAGDLAGARRQLEELHARLPPMAAHQAAYALGEVCHLTGDHACATAALAEFQRQWWPAFDASWIFGRSLYLAALSQERLGRSAEARSSVDRLLALWKDADADLPRLVEAKALRRRLEARAQAPGRRP